MYTYRGIFTVFIANLAIFAPWLAAKAYATNVEAQTIEILTTTYLELGACYNACPSQAWQEWQMTEQELVQHATQTASASDCHETANHVECAGCKDTTYINESPATADIKVTTSTARDVRTYTTMSTAICEHSSSSTQPVSNMESPFSTQSILQSLPSSSPQLSASTRSSCLTTPLSSTELVFSTTKPSAATQLSSTAVISSTTKPSFTAQSSSTALLSSTTKPSSMTQSSSTELLSSTTKPSFVTHSTFTSQLSSTEPSFATQSSSTALLSSTTKPSSTTHLSSTPNPPFTTQLSSTTNPPYTTQLSSTTKPSFTTQSSFTALSSTTKPSLITHSSSTVKPSSTTWPLYTPTSSPPKHTPHPSPGHNSPTLGHAVAQCGNHQTVSCCNKGNTQSNGGLIGSLASGLLGGNCASVNVAVLGLSVPLQHACSGQIACCTGHSNGLVNLKCTQISL